MRRSQKRLLALAVGLMLLIVCGALLYMVGMALLEEEPRSFWRSLGFAAETLSTTGYGEDGTWRHPLMVIFVVLLQFSGVFLIFLIFPVYLIPALEERFQPRLQRTAPDIENAILIFDYGVAVAGLVEEIERAGITALIIEGDIHEARRLVEDGKTVIFGSLADDVLSRIPPHSFRAVVANGSDDESAALTLALRQSGFTGDIFALVEEPYHRKALSVAGATGVFTPRHILAAALAARASDRISPRVEGVQALGRKLLVSEIKVASGSSLVGKTLRDLDIGQRAGVTVIGQWLKGDLGGPPPADTPLEADSILVVAGSFQNVQSFAQSCSAGPVRSGQPFFIAGYGEVGRTISELLSTVGESVQTADLSPASGADLIGDISDHNFLDASQLAGSQAAILAVGSDSATLFATLMVKEYAPHVPIIARVNDAANVERIHRAGADFALSISQVSGQLLAARLLGRETISVDPELQILRAEPVGFEGQHPAELRIRERTGVSVVAVERHDEILVHFDRDFSFSAGDVVYVCGSSEATQRFQDAFPDAAA